MGVPKQRWTSEEEAALRAGIARHGVGKWRTILKDPEFSSTLCYRSNVDLKSQFASFNCTNYCLGQMAQHECNCQYIEFS